MTPKEIMKSLDSVEYGAWFDKEKRPISEKEFDTYGFVYHNCSISHPDELLQRKVGHCYDQSLYEWKKLKESGYDPVMIYMEMNRGDSHACIIFQEDKKWYWMEHSWYKKRGIHGPFRSQKEVTIHILKNFCEGSNKTKPDYFHPNVDVPKILKLKKINMYSFMKICGSKLVQ